MATSQTRSAPASGLPYYIWEVPGKPVSVQLSFDTIDRMHPEIMRGLGALKRRGAEVGGILFGRANPDAEGRIMIEDFEPVPSEYLTGPSYNLSPNDLVAFEAAIARRQSQGDGLPVVGFYRSHTRDELYMDDADVAHAQRYFPGAGNVFLLIKPYATRPSVGGFFFWEDGSIQRESTYLQFPFHRGELGGGESKPLPQPERPERPDRSETTRSGTARPDGERPLPPYTPASEAPPRPVDGNQDNQLFSTVGRSNLSIFSAPPPPEPAFKRRGVLWAIVGFLAVAGIAGFFAYRELALPKFQPQRQAVAETTLPLKLSVAEKQNQLDVTWDRNASAIVQAKRGVLYISDGVNKRDLELTGAQLRTGRVLYSRLSADVSLRLEVFADRPEPVTESIRIVSTEAPPAVPEPEPPPVPAKVAAEPKNGLPVATNPAVQQPKPVTKTPAVVRASESAPPSLGPAPLPPPIQPQAPVEAPTPEVELQRPRRR